MECAAWRALQVVIRGFCNLAVALASAPHGILLASRSARNSLSIDAVTENCP